MKEDAVKQLIKDLVILGCGIAFMIFITVGTGSMAGGFGIFAAVMCSGFPFGWRWLSKIFISLNLYTVVIKFMLSVFLGWIACPVVLIKDVVDVIKAKKEEDDFLMSLVMAQQGAYGAVQQPTEGVAAAQQTQAAPQPQVYRCPTCSGAVTYGEPTCKGCGTVFNW